MKRTIDESFIDIFNAVIYAAKEMDLEIKSKTECTFVLKKSGSLLSYGNIITIQLKPAVGNRTSISISSQSSAAIQLIDWGTNSDLEEELMSLIKEKLS
jgi:hypothetical protein